MGALCRIKVALPPALLARAERRVMAARARGFSCSVPSMLAVMVSKAVERIDRQDAERQGQLIKTAWPLIEGLTRRAERQAEGDVPESDLLAAALEAAQAAARRFDPSKGEPSLSVEKRWVAFLRPYLEFALRRVIRESWRRKKVEEDIEDRTDLTAEAALSEEQQDLMAILKEWAGGNQKRIRALDQIAAAGSIADLPDSIRSSLQRFLEARGESIAEERAEGIPAREAARILNQRERQIRRLCERGELRATRAGGRWLVDPASMEKWREKRKAAA